ncbi:MAG: M23 family metallopeptidase [Proteobacteria bacterium]|nr:M23 family metallopeptidase [Pseudomonadota bacterium]
MRAKVAGAVTTLIGVATILVTVNSLFVLPAIAGQGAAVASLAGGALAASASTSLALALATNPKSKSAAVASPPPTLLAALTSPSERVVEGQIARGDTLAKSLSSQGLSKGAVSQIQRELKDKYDFRRAKAGHGYRVTLDPKGALVSFHYTVSKTEHYWLENDGKSWNAWREEADVRREQKKIAGIVTTSLHDAIEDLGGAENSRLANDYAGIFAWDLDFSRGIQQGDQFRILYERTFAPQGKGRERNLGPGRILAARYHGGGGELQAIYYETEPGRGGYYRNDGTSVQGQFLAAPLNFSRITSEFTHARFHPILHKVRPHPGIDYAAPVGTPIWSVANGVVSYAGWMNGYGRLVKVTHSDGYESYYAHMSSFASGLRVGQPVRQKQVIGYVGSSGLSTGPHVCFRVTKDGEYVDPSRARMASSVERIPKEQWAAFKATRDRRLSELGPAPIIATDEAM